MIRAILCVDDEPIVLTSLKTQLNTFFGNEYDIELAQSAEALRATSPDLRANAANCQDAVARPVRVSEPLTLECLRTPPASNFRILVEQKMIIIILNYL